MYESNELRICGNRSGKVFFCRFEQFWLLCVEVMLEVHHAQVVQKQWIIRDDPNCLQMPSLGVGVV